MPLRRRARCCEVLTFGFYVLAWPGLATHICGLSSDNEVNRCRMRSDDSFVVVFVVDANEGT